MKRIIYLLLLLFAGCALPDDFNERMTAGLVNTSIVYNMTRPAYIPPPPPIHHTNCFNTSYGINCVSN